MSLDSPYALATLAGGCFWCLEAAFERLCGVRSVVSGYCGGSLPDPDYSMVCSGHSGHAEAVQVAFDETTITYRELLEVFFHLHDPTSLNRQGHDVGTQYRSAIFCHSDEQSRVAHALIGELDAQAVWPSPIVTEVRPVALFYRAEDVHQHYYARHTEQPYCQVVIAPKLARLRQVLAQRVNVTHQGLPGPS